MNKSSSYSENIRALKTKVEFIRIKNSKFHACNLSYPNICIKTYQNPIKMPQAKTIILIGFWYVRLMQVFGKEKLRAWNFEFFILMNSTSYYKGYRLYWDTIQQCKKCQTISDDDKLKNPWIIYMKLYDSSSCPTTIQN